MTKFVHLRKKHVSSGYVAKAVHFDGTVSAVNNALVATDNGFSSTVFWAKLSSDASYVLWISDPQGNDDFEVDVIGPNISPTFGAQFNFFEVAGPGQLEVSSGGVGFGDIWACYILSGETNSASPRPAKVYVGDVDVTSIVSETGGSFTQAYNGFPLYIGTNNTVDPKLVGDFADLRIMPGISLLSGGDIPLATRRLFIGANGKPVDPTIATATLGTPCILFSGDSTGFKTNQGNGGSFTFTGALTNASTSPSD